MALKNLSNATRPSKTPNHQRRGESLGFNIHTRMSKGKRARRLKPIHAYGNVEQKQAAEDLNQWMSAQPTGAS